MKNFIPQTFYDIGGSPYASRKEYEALQKRCTEMDERLKAMQDSTRDMLRKIDDVLKKEPRTPSE